jgi:hypothetical protein
MHGQQYPQQYPNAYSQQYSAELPALINQPVELAVPGTYNNSQASAGPPLDRHPSPNPSHELPSSSR